MSGWCSLMACSSSRTFCSIRSSMILLPSEPPPPPGALLALLSAFPCPSLQPEHVSCWGSLLANPPTKQLRPLVIARYVHYSEAYVRVEGLTVEVDVVHRHALASVLTWRDLVGNLLCENHGNLSLPFTLPAHHEPLATIEFVKGGAHCGNPALIAEVEFHAYSVT